jgi:hypothetical protein
MLKVLTALAVLATLPACASITTGQQQSLSVTTQPAAGASCQLSNDKGTWYVASTPGTVTVTRSYSDLTATCEKGPLHGSRAFKSETKAMTFGNIIFGGVIGAAVDAGTGAAYDYPASLAVPLERE